MPKHIFRFDSFAYWINNSFINWWNPNQSNKRLVIQWYSSFPLWRVFSVVTLTVHICRCNCIKFYKQLVLTVLVPDRRDVLPQNGQRNSKWDWHCRQSCLAQTESRRKNCHCIFPKITPQDFWSCNFECSILCQNCQQQNWRSENCLWGIRPSSD